MAAKRDYYDVLGVGRDADPNEIKGAYRKLARQHHPDMNQEQDKKQAEEKFKELSEAYEVLIDPQKKKLYDQFGHQGVSQQFGSGGFTWNDFTHYGDVEDILGDLLGGFFGGGFGGGSVMDRLRGGAGFRGATASGGRRRGADLQVTIPLTLKEIAAGVTKKVKVHRYEKCKACKGAGGKGLKACQECGGRGQVKQVGSGLFGQFVNITTCPECAGRGRVVSEICSECGGSGRVETVPTVAIRIPAGVSKGNYLSLRGQGNAGENGGPSGDLIAVIDEKTNGVFERRNGHVFTRYPVPFSVAALGGKVRVPTLDGDVRMNIPPGTQSGKVFRLKGKGLPELNGYGKGDELVEVFVRVPEKVSPEAANMIRKMDSLLQT
jgi:molecular chaperone DnaJ